LALASAQAVTPAPDGGYANQNTAEGTSALFSLTTGVGNTALGFQALYFDNIQSYNTAVGVRALRVQRRQRQHRHRLASALQE
jgi:rhamnogalacturonyl hydrolase YesR